MEQQKEQTIEEKVRGLIILGCSHTTHSTFSEDRICQVNQIISIVRADERERILEEIESKEYLTAEDMQYIYKLLYTASDTKGGK